MYVLFFGYGRALRVREVSFQNGVGRKQEDHAHLTSESHNGVFISELYHRSRTLPEWHALAVCANVRNIMPTLACSYFPILSLSLSHSTAQTKPASPSVQRPRPMAMPISGLLYFPKSRILCYSSTKIYYFHASTFS